MAKVAKTLEKGLRVVEMVMLIGVRGASVQRYCHELAIV
jgi:hypothetical protein